MNIILCLDNNNGMMFNKRRQSQDKNLRENIKELTKNNFLHMNIYSYNLYKDIDNNNIIVSDDFLDDYKENDFYLVENTSLIPYYNKINELIIYRWNIDYPSDSIFDDKFLNNNFKLIETINFKGISHDKITRDIFRRFT